MREELTANIEEGREDEGEVRIDSEKRDSEGRAGSDMSEAELRYQSAAGQQSLRLESLRSATSPCGMQCSSEEKELIL